MYENHTCTQIKRENDALQYELDNIRREQERDREAQRRRGKERRQSSMEAYRSAQSQASDWPEAFEKGIPRIIAEAYDQEEWQNSPGFEGKPDHYFQELQREVVSAQELYHDIMGEAEKEIERIRRAALAQVADRLEAERGPCPTAQALRDDDPEFLVRW